MKPETVAPGSTADDRPILGSRGAKGTQAMRLMDGPSRGRFVVALETNAADLPSKPDDQFLLTSEKPGPIATPGATGFSQRTGPSRMAPSTIVVNPDSAAHGPMTREKPGGILSPALL